MATITSTSAPEDIAELWQRFKQDQTSQELRNRLVETYLPLVKYTIAVTTGL